MRLTKYSSTKFPGLNICILISSILLNHDTQDLGVKYILEQSPFVNAHEKHEKEI
jgi:hypothetical protein